MRRKRITVTQPRDWRMDDDVTGMPSKRSKLHKLPKYTGLDGLWSEKDIKPSYGLAPFKVPQEQPVDVSRFLEKPVADFNTLVAFDFDTQDPMSTGTQVTWVPADGSDAEIG